MALGDHHLLREFHACELISEQAVQCLCMPGVDAPTTTFNQGCGVGIVGVALFWPESESLKISDSESFTIRVMWCSWVWCGGV